MLAARFSAAVEFRISETLIKKTNEERKDVFLKREKDEKDQPLSLDATTEEMPELCPEKRLLPS